LAIGAVWYLLDVLNVTAIPIWGLAQSFARSWTAYPAAIGFIEVTGISGVVFVLGAVQGVGIYASSVQQQHRCKALITMSVLLGLVIGADVIVQRRKPSGSLRIAVAGWVFDDRSAEIDPTSLKDLNNCLPNRPDRPPPQALVLFTTGEMGFYIADNERAMWLERFSTVAQQTGMWLASWVLEYLSRRESAVLYVTARSDCT
jgi:hypothetical protein